MSLPHYLTLDDAAGGDVGGHLDHLPGFGAVDAKTAALCGGVVLVFVLLHFEEVLARGEAARFIAVKEVQYKVVV